MAKKPPKTAKPVTKAELAKALKVAAAKDRKEDAAAYEPKPKGKRK